MILKIIVVSIMYIVLVGIPLYLIVEQPFPIYELDLLLLDLLLILSSTFCTLVAFLIF